MLNDVNLKVEVIKNNNKCHGNNFRDIPNQSIAKISKQSDTLSKSHRNYLESHYKCWSCKSFKSMCDHSGTLNINRLKCQGYLSSLTYINTDETRL